MKPHISFDYRNCLVSRIGMDGVEETQLDRKLASEAVRVFRKRVNSRQVGFPELPEDRATAHAINKFCAMLRPKIDVVILVGIGGSALGAYAVDVAIHGPHPLQTNAPTAKRKGRRAASPRLVVLDNVDPGVIAAALEQLDPKRAAICVVAKSGSTPETMATFMIVHRWMHSAMGKRTRERVIAITDPKKGDLLALAQQEGYALFAIPGNVGGRFSVLSPAGLVPAALTGVDISKLLRGAADANVRCWTDSIDGNPALASAVVHHALDTIKDKKVEVAFAYSSYLWGAAFWYRQLWAESIGKALNVKGRTVHAGQTPVAALGVTDQHSQLQLYMEGPRDKMITFWAVERFRTDLVVPRIFTEYDSCGYLGGKRLSQLFRAECVATQAALTNAGQPNCRWTLPRVDAYNLGAFVQMLEFQTAFAGELYNIDAFDQPGVELGKKLTYGLMGRKGYDSYARDIQNFGS